MRLTRGLTDAEYLAMVTDAENEMSLIVIDLATTMAKVESLQTLPKCLQVDWLEKARAFLMDGLLGE